MNPSPQNGTLVIGIGNEDRGDDGAGLVAARYVRARALPCVQVVEQSGEATDLMDLWQSIGAQTVYLVDGMMSGAAPGSIQRFEAHRGPLPVQLAGSSTHAFGAAQAIELARVLGGLPPEIVVYAIEGACFEPGAALSPEVEAAARRVAEIIAGAIGSSSGIS